MDSMDMAADLSRRDQRVDPSQARSGAGHTPKGICLLSHQGNGQDGGGDDLDHHGRGWN